LISAPIKQWREPIASARSPHSVWHIVRAVGRRDREVSASLVELGFGVYYPRILEMRPLVKRQMTPRQRNAGIEISRPQLVPLFPRYLFVRFDMGRSGWREVFKIAGVGGLISEGGLPVPVTQTVIDRIGELEEQGTIVAREQQMRVVLAIGQKVRINSGPFADFHATMQSALDRPWDEVDPDTRVRILVNLFGADSVVDIDAWQLDPL
jgi:transcription antitermination factor NusG